MEIIDIGLLERFLREDLDFDQEFAHKLFDTFSKYALEIVGEGFDGSPENIKNLKNMSHRLKSSCHSFGAKQLESLLARLESAADTASPGEISQIYEDVHALIQKTIPEIKTQMDLLLDQKGECA